MPISVVLNHYLTPSETPRHRYLHIVNCFLSKFQLIFSSLKLRFPYRVNISIALLSENRNTNKLKRKCYWCDFLKFFPKLLFQVACAKVFDKRCHPRWMLNDGRDMNKKNGFLSERLIRKHGGAGELAHHRITIPREEGSNRRQQQVRTILG